MEARKIVKSGLASHTISLPIGWVSKHKLRRGDTVFVEEVKDGLLISLGAIQKAETHEIEKVIDTTGRSQYEIARDIVAAYLNNVSKAVLKGNGVAKHASAIREVAANLLGFELVEEDSSRMVFHSFVRLEDAKPGMIVRRIDHLVRSMIIDSVSVLDNPEIAKSINERDSSVNKFCWVLHRVIMAAAKDQRTASELKLGCQDCLSFWEMALHLEKIGDNVKRYSRYVAEIATIKNSKMKNELQNIIEEFKKLYEAALTSYYTTDINLSDKMLNSRRPLSKACDDWAVQAGTSAAANISAKLKAALHHVADIARIARYSA